MARLTRKLWVGIGSLAIAGAALPGAAGAQASLRGQPPPTATREDGAANTPAEGGEAYLTDGGPSDTRIRFYRDIELMRGHLLIGQELIEGDLWDEALPHFLHPTEELYGRMERYIVLHNIPPFRRELQALAQTVKARRMGAYLEARAVVDRQLDSALAVAKQFMHPLRGFAARSAAEVLKVALSEYATSLEDGRFVRPVEYQDSRGFVWCAERLIEKSAGELAKADPAAFAKINAAFLKLKAAWPAPMPPAAPVLQTGEVSALVTAIELNALRY